MKSKKSGNDVFSAMFEAMNISMNSIMTSNIKDKAFQAEQVALHEKCDDKLDMMARENCLESIRNRLRSIKQLRKLIMTKIECETQRKQASLNAINDRLELELESFRCQNLLAERRLSQQLANAERRIRELVFEIIGEYSKSDVRVKRRREYLGYAGRIQMAWTIWRLRWDRFAHRLCHESTLPDPASSQQYESIKSTTLCAIGDAEEMSAVEVRLKNKMGSEWKVGTNVAAMIRFIKTGPTPTMPSTTTTNANVAFKSLPLKLACSTEELAEFTVALRAWAAKAARNARPATPTKVPQESPVSPSIKPLPMRKKATPEHCTEEQPGVIAAAGAGFLSSAPLAWMHPHSRFPEIYDQIYSEDKTSNDIMSAALRSSIDAGVKDSLQSGPDQEPNVSPSADVVAGLDGFIARFGAQHTSFIMSDRVYLSLDERAEAVSLDGLEGYDAMDVYAGLQRHYCRPRDGNLSTLRSQLSQRLLVTDRLVGSHRSLLASPALEALPDIVQARSVGGSLLHFAPALGICLAETHALQQAKLNSEQLKHFSCKCPHPALLKLARARHGDGNKNDAVQTGGCCSAQATTTQSCAPLSTLYVLVRTLQFGTSGNGPALAATANNTRTTSANSREDLAVEEIMLMVPLHQAAVWELIRMHCWSSGSIEPAASPGSSSSNSSSHGIESSSPHSSPQVPYPGYKCSFADLVPDHARCYLSPGMSGRDTRDTTRLCSNSTGMPNVLRCRYALLSGEYTYTLPPAESKGETIKMRQCYYLVQLHEAEDNEGKTGPPLRSGQSDCSDLHASDDSFLRTVLTARAKGLGGTTNPGQTEDALVKRKWDPAILSNLCRWRSCLCESTATVPRYLCAYHTELYGFLENGNTGKNSSSSEAAKYLPKKAPVLPSASPLSDPKRDLMMIKAASTLLQELWDGKLRATVKSFTKKVVIDMSLRRRLEAAASAETAAEGRRKSDSVGQKGPKGQGSSRALEQDDSQPVQAAKLTVPRPPSWSVWKNEDLLSSTLTAQATRHAALESILSLETAATAELKQLGDLRVYPSAELAQIRREVKSFKESFDDGGSADHGAQPSSEDQIAMTAAELKLSEWKLSVLRSKRHEEAEARSAAMRKTQRQQMRADEQTRDPTNFAFNPNGR